MDDELTADYRVPCAQCSEVDWGVSDEGRFYCRSCHNVIERTREVENQTFAPGSTRVSTIGRGTRNKRSEAGRQWRVCEGLQFILAKQADALLALGIAPRFKEEVLCPLWRRYLQRSGQAFTRVTRADSETEATDTGSGSDWSPDPDARRGASLTTTLALLHLALTWSREALTLSDLLRLAKEGRVPFVNAFQDLPEEMKLEGKDALIFRVESVPSHRVVHGEAQSLLSRLRLPAFPPVCRRTLLHPVPLCLRYLIDLNLPDQLHPWLCRLMERTGTADEALLTYDPERCPVLPRYDVQAAALIAVAMKLLFGLDDRTEWESSNAASEEPGHVFSLRRWFRLLQGALTRAQMARDQQRARKRWTAAKPLFSNRRKKCVVIKKKRVAEQLQGCFERLSRRPASEERGGPTSFRFRWGDGDQVDGPSLHRQRLGPRRSDAAYWHPALRPCDPRKCSSHFAATEASLPRLFVWLLGLLGFLLEVKPALVYEEVLRIERRLVGRRRTRTAMGGATSGTP